MNNLNRLKKGTEDFLRFLFYILIFFEVWNQGSDQSKDSLEQNQVQNAQVGKISHQREQGYQCISDDQSDHLDQHCLIDCGFAVIQSRMAVTIMRVEPIKPIFAGECSFCAVSSS